MLNNSKPKLDRFAGTRAGPFFANLRVDTTTDTLAQLSN